MSLTFKLNSGLIDFFSDKKSIIAAKRFINARVLFFIVNSDDSDVELKRRTNEDMNTAKQIKLK